MSNNYDGKKQRHHAPHRGGTRHEQIQNAEESTRYESMPILNQYSRNNLLHTTVRTLSIGQGQRLRMPILGTHIDVVVPRR